MEGIIFTQSEIAELFDLSQRAISKILQNLNLEPSSKFNSRKAIREVYNSDQSYNGKIETPGYKSKSVYLSTIDRISISYSSMIFLMLSSSITKEEKRKNKIFLRVHSKKSLPNMGPDPLHATWCVNLTNI
ncbi:hypothetical protein AKJ66_00390 [candidate division MSBL1 archaeon SCGC-AAA259E22]|uniref:Uncharacterized protein n=1 Tax=candidate division MSBL1 archaeon SCGC-AAA259E22 TaxID=1698265 RepID=A0A133UI31_9EURY|nr:hypothetical protein AKJ66_00390 [candidate division MSBL1 archaeon SCGC-AAA259E22]